MMAEINFDSEEWDHPTERYRCRGGDKVFAVIGMQPGETGNGTPKNDLECLCMIDLADPVETDVPPTDVGLTCRGTIFRTDKGRRYGLVPLARALGWNKPIDDDDAGQVLEMAISGYFIAPVKTKPGKNRNGDDVIWAEVNFSRAKPYEGDVPEEWKDLCNDASAAYEERRSERRQGGSYQPQSGDPF